MNVDFFFFTFFFTFFTFSPFCSTINPVLLLGKGTGEVWGFFFHFKGLFLFVSRQVRADACLDRSNLQFPLGYQTIVLHLGLGVYMQMSWVYQNFSCDNVVSLQKMLRLQKATEQEWKEHLLFLNISEPNVVFDSSSMFSSLSSTVYNCIKLLNICPEELNIEHLSSGAKTLVIWIAASNTQYSMILYCNELM